MRAENKQPKNNNKKCVDVWCFTHIFKFGESTASARFLCNTRILKQLFIANCCDIVLYLLYKKNCEGKGRIDNEGIIMQLAFFSFFTRPWSSAFENNLISVGGFQQAWSTIFFNPISYHSYLNSCIIICAPNNFNFSTA